jgi:hypothetical protein
LDRATENGHRQQAWRLRVRAVAHGVNRMTGHRSPIN